MNDVLFGARKSEINRGVNIGTLLVYWKAPNQFSILIAYFVTPLMMQYFFGAIMQHFLMYNMLPIS